MPSELEDQPERNGIPEPAASTQEIGKVETRKPSHGRPSGAANARRPPKVPLAPRKRVQAKFNPLADALSYLVVFVGGCFGTAMRYALWLAMPYPGSDSGLWLAFHPATFIANMVACFIFALLSSYMTQAVWIKKRARQLTSRGVGMGMCGGFSTLSAMMIEDVTALRSGMYFGFFIYTMLSFICGLIVSYLGAVLALRITAKRSGKLAVAAMAEANKAKPAIGVRVPPDPRVATGKDPVPSTPATSEGQAVELPAPVLTSIQNPSTTELAQLCELVPSFEPDPRTDEIPVVPDPETGEVK